MLKLNKKHDTCSNKTVPSGYTIPSWYFNVGVLIIALVVYLICLYSQRHFITADTNCQAVWWNYINEHGFRGIATLNNSIDTGGIAGDYTTIWYFITWIFVKIGFYPHFPIEYNIKLIAIISSMVSAVVVYFIVRHFRPKAKHMPVMAMITTLFLPPFFMEVIKTNLPDTVYLMFALLAFLSFIKGRISMAWLLLGFGICFKLMAIYLAPFFIYFYLKEFKKYNLWQKLSPVFCLVSVFLCSIPNVISNGSWIDGIIGPIMSRSDQFMTSSAYSLWQLMPNDVDNFKYFSVALAILVFVIVFLFVHCFVPKERKQEIEYTILLPLSPMICYFLLPAQHEAYFSMAAVFAFIIWCFKPKKRTFLVFILLNVLLFVAFCTISFRYFLPDGIQFGKSIVYDFQLLALLFAAIIFYLGYQIFKNSTFYSERLSK